MLFHPDFKLATWSGEIEYEQHVDHEPGLAAGSWLPRPWNELTLRSDVDWMQSKPIPLFPVPKPQDVKIVLEGGRALLLRAARVEPGGEFGVPVVFSVRSWDCTMGTWGDWC